jgi:hypothetical protein
MKGKGLIIAFAITLFVGLIIYFVYVNRNNNKYDWTESYKASNIEPYGGFIFSKLLEDYFPKHEFNINKKSYIKAGIFDNNKKISNFIFLGQVMYLNKKNAASLINWVEKGNTALLIASELPSEIDSLFKLNSVNKEDWSKNYSINDSIIAANFYQAELNRKENYTFHYQFAEKKMDYYWKHINGIQFENESKLKALAYLDSGFVNFCSVKIGSGKIFYHTNPLFFSNYHLIQKDRAEYVSKVLSFLPEADILLDQYALSWQFNQQQGNGSGSGKSPLSFILNNEALRWGWYTFLTLVFCYILIGIRRHQKAIKVIEPLNNTSLEFVNTIGRLQFLQKNHPSLIRHQMRYLMLFIREKYKIFATDLNEEIINQIAIKSGVNKEDIQAIQNKYELLKNCVELDDNEAIEFYKLINKFLNISSK